MPEPSSCTVSSSTGASPPLVTIIAWTRGSPFEASSFLGSAGWPALKRPPAPRTWLFGPSTASRASPLRARSWPSAAAAAAGEASLSSATSHPARSRSASLPIESLLMTMSRSSSMRIRSAETPSTPTALKSCSGIGMGRLRTTTRGAVTLCASCRSISLLTS